jgi:myosin heavy subunit
MGNDQPPSRATSSSQISAACHKLASLSLVQALLRLAPGLPAAVLAGAVIMFFAWSCERQARQRELTQAKQEKKQATEEISRLQQHAAGALRQAQQSAQAVRELESQRQKIAREAEGLRQSLESLRKQELARTDEVATLPTSEVASRVASRLQEQGTGNREQGTEQQALNPLTRPAPADENAVAGHPLPQGGEGQNNPGRLGQTKPEGENQVNPTALVLSDPGVRKVETAFIELDSCRQQTQVMEQQISNCAEQAKLDATLQEQQSGTISKLNAALADKDQVLAHSEEAHRAELKAARGTWRARLLRAVEIFAGGFIAGVLVR